MGSEELKLREGEHEMNGAIHSHQGLVSKLIYLH